jgi:hypothetical protein
MAGATAPALFYRLVLRRLRRLRIEPRRGNARGKSPGLCLGFNLSPGGATNQDLPPARFVDAAVEADTLA